MKLISLLATVAIFATVQAHAKQDMVCVAVRGLNPDLDQGTVDRYVRSIKDHSKRYEVDWKIAVAIFKQESNFNVKAVNWKTRDFGIGQLHYKTIENMQVDLGQLLSDHDYAIEQTFKILRELRVKYDKIDNRNGQRWYTRYHSFNTTHRNDYKLALGKHLKNIEDLSNGSRRRTSREISAYKGGEAATRGEGTSSEKDPGVLCNVP